MVDVESTCGPGVEEAARELIEFGCVFVDLPDLSVVGEMSVLVRPTGNPVLTQFCLDLTGITQADVDNALPLLGALAVLPDAIAAFSPELWCSWGKFDRKLLTRVCQDAGLRQLFTCPHLDLKAQHAVENKIRKHGLSRAHEFHGVPFRGRHHRALDDARAAVDLLPFTPRLLRGAVLVK